MMLNVRQFVLGKLDGLQKKIAPISYLDPKKPLTENRKDIQYRYLFLSAIFEKGLLPVETLYYHFISDANRGVVSDGKIMSDKFINLYMDIKKNGIKKPLIVGRYNPKYIKARYISDGVKHWEYIKNDTGYQIMAGGHRLAIALYLGYNKIPCKIYKPLSFEVPNYTKYIQLHEPEYMQLIENLRPKLHKKISGEL